MIPILMNEKSIRDNSLSMSIPQIQLDFDLWCSNTQICWKKRTFKLCAESRDQIRKIQIGLHFAYHFKKGQSKQIFEMYQKTKKATSSC